MQFAIVGYGRSGHALRSQIESLPGASVTCVVDADSRRAHTVAGRLNATAWSDNASVALRRAKADAVCIAGPHASRAQLVQSALEQGLHVFIEPPVALRHPDAQQVLGYARAARTTVAVNFWMRTVSGVRRMRRRIPRPTFVQVEAVVHPLSESSRGMPEHGGVMGLFGSHALDLAGFLMQSTPRYVQAMGGRHTRRAALADTVTVGIRYANGGLARVIVGEFGRTRPCAPWRAYATDGAVTATAQGHLPWDEAATGHASTVERDRSQGAYAGQFEGVRAFANAVAGRGKPLAVADDGVRAAHLTDSAYESMSSRHRVSIAVKSLPDTIRPVYGNDAVANRRNHSFRS